MAATRHIFLAQNTPIMLLQPGLRAPRTPLGSSRHSPCRPPS